MYKRFSTMLGVYRLLPRVSLQKLFPAAPKIFSVPHALYAQFVVRDVMAVPHGETGSLLHRFIKHIALENCKNEPVISREIRYSDFYPVTDLRAFQTSLQSIPTDQIPRFVIFTYTYKTNGDPQKIAKVLEAIDKLCVNRIDSMNHETLLGVLYALMYLLPSRITKFDFYLCSMQRLVAEIDDDTTKRCFVDICFYLGLWKKHKKSMELAKRIKTEHLERYVDSLSSIELAIVADALFKSSTICENVTFRERLVEEVLQSDGSDDSLLVTFVKSLRLNRLKSNKVYSKIIELKEAGILEKMQFKGLVHVFAVLADGAYNDIEVCDWFVKECLRKLKVRAAVKFFDDDIRSKDISTFVWSCATLGCNELASQHFSFLTKIVYEKIKREEYKYHPDVLIDTVLSFWMLGHRSHDLVQAVFDLPQIYSSEPGDRVKLDSRLDLLKSCVQIEEPEWMPLNCNKKFKAFIQNRKAPDYLIEKQPGLENVHNFINENKTALGIRSVNCVAPIYQLNIASILLEPEVGEKIFIEVLEEKHLLKFDEKLSPIMSLKLRLLKRLGYKIFLVNPNWNSQDLLSDLKCVSNSNSDMSVKTMAS